MSSSSTQRIWTECGESSVNVVVRYGGPRQMRTPRDDSWVAGYLEVIESGGLPLDWKSLWWFEKSFAGLHGQLLVLRFQLELVIAVRLCVWGRLVAQFVLQSQVLLD